MRFPLYLVYPMVHELWDRIFVVIDGQFTFRRHVRRSEVAVPVFSTYAVAACSESVIDDSRTYVEGRLPMQLLFQVFLTRLASVSGAVGGGLNFCLLVQG